jgi:hypothetical protein
MDFAREIRVDSFGVKHVEKEYIVDGQQRKRNFSLLFIVINKLYPNLQLDKLIPFTKDKDGVRKPVVTHKDTDQYMLDLWKSSGLIQEPKNPNLAVKSLHSNYQYIYHKIQELNWSEEKMAAFLVFFSENVKIGAKIVKVEDSAKAFMDSNTNQATLRQFQLIKAGISSHLIHNPALADKFCSMFDANIEKLRIEHNIAKGKIDDLISSMFRALYAVDTGSTGEASLDSLNHPFGWIENNADSIGLSDDQGWEDLAFKHIPHLFRALFLLLKAECTYDIETRHIKERSLLGGDYAHAVMLCHTVGQFNDTDKQILEKLTNGARASMKLTDIYERSNRRRIDGKVRPNIVELMKLIRGKNTAEGTRAISKFFDGLEKQFKSEGYLISDQVKESSATFNRFCLRAVETMLKLWSGETRDLAKLWDDVRDTNSLTIEHMVPVTYGSHGETAFSPFEAPSFRELLSLQGLLPQTYNSSVQDKHISDKTPVYLSKGGNWLASVSPDFYKGSGKVISVQLAEKLKENNISLTPLEGGEITLAWVEQRSAAFNALLGAYHNLGEAPAAVLGDCDYHIIDSDATEEIASGLASFTLNVRNSCSDESLFSEDVYTQGEIMNQGSDTLFNIERLQN